MSKPKAETKEKFWLYAFRDHLANLQAYPNCIHTADVAGDGDYKLLVADGSKKLKTYAGTALSQETRLLGVPSAVTSFYMDTGDAFNRPTVAVAVGPYIFMYRNSKPLYRFTTPPVPLDPEEVGTWASLAKGDITIDEAAAIFEKKLDQGVDVSTRTLELLLMDSPIEREGFVLRFIDKPLIQNDVIVCMSALARDSPEEGQPSCLVYGTEKRLLFVLGNDASTVKERVELPSTPVVLVPTGTLRETYRIIVSCRDGRIYSVKDGALHSSTIQPDAQPCGISRYNNLIAVITMANTLSYYGLKGKRQDVVFLPVPATNITTITDTVTGHSRGVVVALSNGEIRVYVGKHLQHVSQAYGTVTVLSYCRYGREDSALVLVLQNGSLVVQLLHRNANLSVANDAKGAPPPEQDIPIPVPRLSSVFAVQTEREREYGVDMYRNFQYDLCHLKLLVSRSYLSMMTNGTVPAMPAIADATGSNCYSTGVGAAAGTSGGCGSITTAAIAVPQSGSAGSNPIAPSVGLQSVAASPDASSATGAADTAKTVPETGPSWDGSAVAGAEVTIGSGGGTTIQQRASVFANDSSVVQLVATVQGLGPLYKVKGTIQNVGDMPLHDLLVAFVYDAETYKMPKSLFSVPYLVPGLIYPCDALVELKEGETKGEGVLALVLSAEESGKPIASALVDLPEADIMEGF